MSSSTGGAGSWPFERVGGDPSASVGGGTAGRAGQPADRPVAPTGFAGPTTPEHSAGGSRREGRAAGGGAGGAGGAVGRPGRRRPPVWLLVVIGLVVVGAVVAAILVLTNDKAETPVVPEAETVTLPVPTPTVTPMAREAGTAFQEAIPSTVLDYVMSAMAEHDPLLVAGAVEGWAVTYTNGAQDVALYAGQFRDAAAAEAAFDQVLAANPIDAGATDATTEPPADDAAAPTDGATSTTPPEPAPTPEQGTVDVDGQQVGRFLFVPHDDGTASLWWTNTTVLLHLDGPPAAIRDLYAAFPL